MAQSISIRELNELLAIFQPIKCWQFSRYLGSTLTFDFGDKVEAKTRNGHTVLKGSLIFGVRNVLWIAIDGERTIATAETVNDEIFLSQLSQKPIGVAIEKLKVRKAANG